MTYVTCSSILRNRVPPPPRLSKSNTRLLISTQVFEISDTFRFISSQNLTTNKITPTAIHNTPVHHTTSMFSWRQPDLESGSTLLKVTKNARFPIARSCCPSEALNVADFQLRCQNGGAPAALAPSAAAAAQKRILPL